MINEKLSEIAQILCDLDSDRLVRNVDYKLNLQREIDLRELRLDQDNDGISDLIEEFKTMMGRPLFEFFDFEKIISRRTYKTFFRLFNNYNEEINKQEIETYRESREQDDFIDACMETELMKEAHRFLVREEKAPEDEEEFKKMLDDIWFDFYGRSDKEL
ncbi:poly(U)-specific endoribonuclease-B [Brachionus plicatilis]|uniref:Uridylate-specific endoribonuclease n=1 Tax=Brachionus plicatilis TaxID=10195 RepID=A0A3M7RFB5_BRAPC|nr:poly(U)-specific endoribonuclease-B [Brachionus plicatilis]RNA22207.1 poly(U)-specific endoribonuclease-B [Brachionus plicatilis]